MINKQKKFKAEKDAKIEELKSQNQQKTTEINDMKIKIFNSQAKLEKLKQSNKKISIFLSLQSISYFVSNENLNNSLALLSQRITALEAKP